MNKVLFLAHSGPDGRLPKAAREALSAALEISAGLEGAELSVGLVGGDVNAAAHELAGCGAARCLAVSGADFASARYATDVAAVEALVAAAEARIVVAPCTSRFARVLPGAAARCGGRMDSHVTGIELAGGELTAQRWYYRQRMVARLTRAHRPWFLGIDPGVFAPREPEEGSLTPQPVAVEIPEGRRRTVVEGVVAASSDVQTIRPDADLLFVAGAGWTKKQADGETHVGRAQELITTFIERAQASLGSSKSLVDQSSEGRAVLSCLSHLNQVGQTGSTPRHPKGLSTCCHGEEPHVVGWRFITERRAVNLDAGCGWAQGKADVLYVADAFAVMEEVNRLLAD